MDKTNQKPIFAQLQNGVFEKGGVLIYTCGFIGMFRMIVSDRKEVLKVGVGYPESSKAHPAVGQAPLLWASVFSFGLNVIRPV